MIDKHINEKQGNLTLVARSTKANNGYLAYYWCLCKCGNYKRYRYDQARKNGNCGQCEDFTNSRVVEKLKGLGSGNE